MNTDSDSNNEMQETVTAIPQPEAILPTAAEEWSEMECEEPELLDAEASFTKDNIPDYFSDNERPCK